MRVRFLRLALEIVLILCRWYYDPARLREAVDERLEREQQERSQEFRKAIGQRDADTVSGMLADLRKRLRNKDRVSDR